MRDNLLTPLGETLRNRRRERRMTQPMLATRLGRSTPRISELENHLLKGRPGKDRLGLLVEICDVLDLVPVLVPRERIQAIQRHLQGSLPSSTAAAPGRAFDDLFVDLSEDENDAPGAR